MSFLCLNLVKKVANFSYHVPFISSLPLVIKWFDSTSGFLFGSVHGQNLHADIDTVLQSQYNLGYNWNFDRPGALFLSTLTSVTVLRSPSWRRISPVRIASSYA